MKKIAFGALLTVGPAGPALAADCCAKANGNLSACKKTAEGEKMACCDGRQH